jgi:hypothetical protein
VAIVVDLPVATLEPPMAIQHLSDLDHLEAVVVLASYQLSRKT